jgi:SAM-dependent methyltransferase
MQSFMGEFLERLQVDAQHEALEVGAGSGALTALLAGQAKSLLATDFAPEMVEIVRERIAAEGLTNVTFEVMDGQALSLEDASFDRVACSFALMLFPDRAKGFREFRRVLRPGGRAMISAWAGPDKFEAFGLFLTALKLAYPEMPPPASPPPVFSLANPSEFKAEMEAAGFNDVEVDFVAREMEVDTFESAWEMFTAGAPPVQMIFDRLGSESRTKVRDALAGVIEERFGSGPIRVTNVATLGSGSVD